MLAEKAGDRASSRIETGCLKQLRSDLPEVESGQGADVKLEAELVEPNLPDSPGTLPNRPRQLANRTFLGGVAVDEVLEHTDAVPVRQHLAASFPAMNRS
jgi:hypothetical protein